MGVIQNSINQALGSVAGAALGIKHTEEQKISNALAAQHQSLIAEGQATDLELQAAEKKAENKELSADYNIAKKAYELNKEHAERLNGVNSTYYNDLEKAKTALSVMRAKIKANKEIQERAVKQREYAQAVRDIADKQAKFLGGRE